MSILSHPAQIHIGYCHTAPHISQKILLPWVRARICPCSCEVLWEGVTMAEISFWHKTRELGQCILEHSPPFHYPMSFCLAVFSLSPRVFTYFCVKSHSRASNKPPDVFHVFAQSAADHLHVWLGGCGPQCARKDVPLTLPKLGEASGL